MPRRAFHLHPHVSGLFSPPSAGDPLPPPPRRTRPCLPLPILQLDADAAFPLCHPPLHWACVELFALFCRDCGGHDSARARQHAS